MFVGADIEESAGRVIRTSTEGITVGKEADTVDVRFVAGECLDAVLALSLSVIPQLGSGVARTRDKVVTLVINGYTHNVTGVVVEDSFGCLGLNVPENTCGVTRGGDDLIVADETAA